MSADSVSHVWWRFSVFAVQYCCVEERVFLLLSLFELLKSYNTPRGWNVHINCTQDQHCPQGLCPHSVQTRSSTLLVISHLCIWRVLLLHRGTCFLIVVLVTAAEILKYLMVGPSTSIVNRISTVSTDCVLTLFRHNHQRFSSFNITPM